MLTKKCKNCCKIFNSTNKRKVFCSDKCQRQNYKKSPEGKLADKKYRQSEKGKAWWKKYKSSDTWKICNLRYEKGTASKLRYKRYRQTKKRKNVYIKYLNSKPEVKIAKNLRIRLRKILIIQSTYKKDSTFNLVGCTVEKLKYHLERQFKDGMTWFNYGVFGWHIDHIIPCSKFDLSKLEEQKKCFHFTNLQPLWAADNIKKSNKVNYERRYYAEEKKAS